MTTVTAKHTNRLIHSTSPYLLQHAHNPVDWHPWGEEAFAKARKENKPIFLSIGYAACHWCHVMAHESFESEETAQMMNDLFVCIKVDREERPEIDAIYMDAVQMMTGSGGWPLSVFLTPELKPYFGGTYFPPAERQGMPAFQRVLEAAAKVYHENRADVDKIGAQLMAALREMAAGPKEAAKITGEPMIRAAEHYAKTFDAQWGGFGAAPKFPPTGAIDLLLRHHERTGEAHALEMATVTLDRMAAGGMYDQLGGGFHRYSVDKQWGVPHFEKMLYDNALLAAAYVDGWRVTRKALYLRVARETLDYVLRDMTDPAGGFHSSQDADSEGHEGRYYIWSRDEIEAALGATDAGLFIRYYGVTADGNFEGKHILHVPVAADAFAKQCQMTEDELLRRIDAMKVRLLAVRGTRVPPAKDDKVLADWNGLMISALAKGYQVTGDERYRAAAERAAAFLFAEMRPKSGLLHAWRAGQAHVDAGLDDYAFLLEAMLDLYESTFDLAWIRHAQSLEHEMRNRLWDDAAGGFYSTQSGRADLLVRTKSANDGALPAGNAVAAQALLRLARLTDDKACLARAEKTLGLFFSQAAQIPAAFTRLLCAADFALGPEREIVITGSPVDPSTRALLSTVRERYLPNAVTALIDPGSTGSTEAIRILPLLEGRALVADRPAAYVCEHYACQAPVISPDELLRLLAPKPQRK